MKGYIRPSSGNREVSSSQIFGDKAVEATLPESRIMGFAAVVVVV